MRSKREEMKELKTRLVLAAVVVIAMIIVGGSKDSLVRGAATGTNVRQLITRVEPDVTTLKNVNAGDVVRVEALVAADGSVKATRLLEGNAQLGQASMNAIRQWKYAPAAADETITVQLQFDSGSGE